MNILLRFAAFRISRSLRSIYRSIHSGVVFCIVLKWHWLCKRYIYLILVSLLSLIYANIFEGNRLFLFHCRWQWEPPAAQEKVLVGLSSHCTQMEVYPISLPLSKGRLGSFSHTFSYCSQIVLAHHNELSNKELATCTRVLPTMESLMLEWEDLLDEPEFEPVHHKLQAGIALIEKYYCSMDDTDAYFIAHGQFRIWLPLTYPEVFISFRPRPQAGVSQDCVGGEICESWNGLVQFSGNKVFRSFLLLLTQHISPSFSFIKLNTKQFRVNLSYQPPQLLLMV